MDVVFFWELRVSIGEKVWRLLKRSLDKILTCDFWWNTAIVNQLRLYNVLTWASKPWTDFIQYLPPVWLKVPPVLSADYNHQFIIIINLLILADEKCVLLPLGGVLGVLLTYWLYFLLSTSFLTSFTQSMSSCSPSNLSVSCSTFCHLTFLSSFLSILYKYVSLGRIWYFMRYSWCKNNGLEVIILSSCDFSGLHSMKCGVLENDRIIPLESILSLSAWISIANCSKSCMVYRVDA